MDTSDLRIETVRTTLVLAPREFHEAALAGRIAGAEEALGATVPKGWPDEDDRFLLEIRLVDLKEHPERAPWLLRAIVEDETQRMIGHVGFHGPPDDAGLAEIGYTIFPDHRRKGFAEEAVRALFAWALEKEGVKGFRASVGPRNDPSLKMVAKLGFRQVGVQWDERDGQEMVFELHPSADEN